MVIRLIIRVKKQILWLFGIASLTLSSPSFSSDSCIKWGEPEAGAFDARVIVSIGEDGSLRFTNRSEKDVGSITLKVVNQGISETWEIDLMKYGRPALRIGETVPARSQPGWMGAEIIEVRKYPCITTAEVYREVYGNCLIAEMRGIADDGTQARVRQKCHKIASEPSIYERWKYSD